MKFIELSKTYQDYLIEALSDAIDNAAEEINIEESIEPTYGEYVEFFDECYEDFKIDKDGCPDSVIELDFRNTMEIEFEGKKVKLNVNPPRNYQHNSF